MAADGGSEPKHSILTIPPELCERIAQSAEPSDLFNLRLVCKEVDARIFRTYGKTHFAHRAVLLCSLEGAQMMAEFAASRSLARFLEELTLCVETFPNPTGYLNRWPRTDPTSIVPAVHALELRLMRQTQRRNLEERYRQQDDHRCRAIRQYCWLNTFCCLREQGIHPKIRVTTASEAIKPYFANNTRAQIGAALEVTRAGIRRHLEMLLDTLALSALSIQELEMDILNDKCGMPFYEMAGDSVRLSRIQSVFAGLRQLRICVDTRGRVLRDDEKRSFVETIANAPLQTLEVWWCPRFVAPDLYLHAEFLAQRFATLEHLTIGGRFVAYGDLVRFLRLQPKLESATLEECTIELEEKVSQFSDGEIVRDLETRGSIRTMNLWACVIGDEEARAHLHHEMEEDDNIGDAGDAAEGDGVV